MRKINIIIGILMLGGAAYFNHLFFDPRVVSEKYLLCDGQPRNVILIIPETLSARHMGIYGYERDTTPFIDEFFSEESLVFENAWSNAPWTVPSFAALFTSQLASDVFLEGYHEKLSNEILTFVDVLRINGIPKFAAHSWPLFPHPNIDINLVTRLEAEERFQPRFSNEASFQEEDHLVFLKAVEWIEAQIKKNNSQPFFLLIQPLGSKSPYHPSEPHRFLFDAPAEYPGPVLPEEISGVEIALQRGEDVETELQRFRLQYDQEIHCIDSEFESFIRRIPEEVLCSTVFIFISDHGEAFGQHGQLDHGRTVYEEEIHVPLLIRAPGINSKRVQEPITLLDVGPTILDVFDLEIPDTFQGISMLPLLRGEELQLEDRIVRAEHILFKTAFPLDFSRLESQVRTGPILLTKENIAKWGLTAVERFIAVRKGEWKLIRGGECYVRNTPSTLELYNLERDYYEQDNLILRWHDLPEKDQVEIIPLFEALGEGLPE